MELRLHKSFIKKFKKLPLNVRQQFGQRVKLFKTDKFNKLLNNHSVDTAYAGCRSINITGDYRAIFREESNLVTFTNIGTHSQLY